MTKQQIQENEKQQDQKQNSKRQQQVALCNKKHKSIIKRITWKNCPLSRIDYKHIVNVNDVWYINQQTLKDCNGSDDNIQRAMFRYKMISKIVLNPSFVGLQLKIVDENYLPPQYFFQRFRSFGDQQIASIANSLQKVYFNFNSMTFSETQLQLKVKNHKAIKQLNQFLNQMNGKMFIVYFVQISKKRVNLKHIFFSVPLLKKLGWNIKRVALDFMRYRHVFFEIFSPKNYKNYIETCLNTYMKAQEVLGNPDLSQSQKQQLITVYFDDEVVRQIETQNGIYEQFLKVKVKFSCPNTSFCCVEILKIDEDQIRKMPKERKPKKQMIQTSVSEQLSHLKSLGFENSFLEFQENVQQVDK